MLLGVDVGGTFTDAVLALDGRLVTAKAPSTPSDQSEGVMAAVEAVLARAGRRADELSAFSHGMTVATNALLEGKGARTAFVATEGFGDLIALGRQARAELYRLCAARPAPLAPPELRFGVPERMTPAGPLRVPTEAELTELVEEIKQSNVESVAVTLLHSYRHPQHERALGEALSREFPDAHVSLSHEVVGTFREYERAATTEIDAALSPLLAGYLRRLVDRCEQASLPTPDIMQSNGGLIELDAAASHAALTVLSGPAAGAAGAAFVARAAEARDAVCFDMGGTSCDVCVIEDGSVQERTGGEIAGRPVALPMLAVHSVGAGGGSIAWRDAGGALRVGPRSAGAEPGPACYGRGGTEPTVTDANLLLGYLSADAPLAGGVELDRRAAERAIDQLAAKLELEPMACAEGIIRVANSEMVRALRVVTVQRGIDPRGHALLAFGGAGPLHAVAIAEELEMTRVICPRASGVLAALGLVVSQRRRDVQRSVFLSGDELSAEAIRDSVEDLAAQVRSALEDREGLKLQATYELRYHGQAFELPVEADMAPEPAALRSSFERQHEDRYGYRDPDGTLELVTIRVTGTLPGFDIALAQDESQEQAAPSRGRRSAVLGGEELSFDVLRGAPEPGTSLAGPGIVELAEATLLIPSGWHGEVDDGGNICLEPER
jgi:N-methylhydantoinase A